MIPTKAKALPQEEQWRLAEILDPDTFTHYEFFLTKGKVSKKDWTAVSEEELHQAYGIRQVPRPGPAPFACRPLPCARGALSQEQRKSRRVRGLCVCQACDARAQRLPAH